RGIGTNALAAAEEYCRTAGLRAIVLEVSREDVRAREFYARAGFLDRGHLLLVKPVRPAFFGRASLRRASSPGSAEARPPEINPSAPSLPTLPHLSIQPSQSEKSFKSSPPVCRSLAMGERTGYLRPARCSTTGGVAMSDTRGLLDRISAFRQRLEAA